MSSDANNSGTFATDAGLVADLRGASASSAAKFLVGHTSGKESNALRQHLRAEAGFRMEAQRFDVGSSFILPNACNEFALLGKLRAPSASGDQALQLAIFGHADATGSDSDNKTLAGRRAHSVYGLLIRDVDVWEQLYSAAAGSDKWGVRAIQWMLAVNGYPSGRIRNELDAQIRQAISDYQTSAGLPSSGSADAATRAKLFAVYMDKICVDEAGQPLVYRASDFLGRGIDAGGKAAFQGCGELNPIIVPSQKHVTELNRPENKQRRDEEYLNNRRLLIYLFAARLEFPIDKWPCPRASEGSAGCQRMLWHDADKRRSPSDKHREHGREDETMGCRFYEGFAHASPCEQTRRTVAVWLLDGQRRRMPGAPFRAVVGTQTITGNADAEGKIRIEDVFASRSLSVSWGPQLEHSTQLAIDLDDEANEDEDEAQKRLANLGYAASSFDAGIAAFQRDYGLAQQPWPDAATQKVLFSAHIGGQESTQPAQDDASTTEPSFEPLGRGATR